MFKILKKDRTTNARLGVLSTPHGKIQTPSYVIVATHAQIKCLKPSDIKKTKTQVVIANTYHLWGETTKHKSQNTNKTQSQKHKTQTFLLNRMGTKLPTMTDSGGFQIFSLGFGQNRIGKILTPGLERDPREAGSPLDKRHRKSVIHRRNIRIIDKGVYFKWNGKERFFGPELSMKIQEKLGADMIFAFDECTSPLDNFNYNKKALERTHRWARICLKVKDKSSKQLLFGIVQGGKYKSLRVKSAKYIASLPFYGIGIGGSFGKDEMVKTLKWIVPYLPEEKPRHLLGIGKIKDIFNAVEQGMDLFDCVIPTREARHGRIHTKNGHFDISKFRDSNIPFETGCKCLACTSGVSRKKLYMLFKGSASEKQEAQRWATVHNVWFFNNLLEDIRKSIAKGKFREFKKKFLANTG